MQARYYAPELRRFISADTIVPDPGASIGYNRFAYAYQNPVSFIDPTGHYGLCIQGGTQDAVQLEGPLFDMCQDMALNGDFGEVGDCTTDPTDFDAACLVITNNNRDVASGEEWLLNHNRRDAEDVTVIGYSWGGGAALELAWHLNVSQGDNFTIHALVLLDPVLSGRDWVPGVAAACESTGVMGAFCGGIAERSYYAVPHWYEQDTGYAKVSPNVVRVLNVAAIKNPYGFTVSLPVSGGVGKYGRLRISINTPFGTNIDYVYGVDNLNYHYNLNHCSLVYKACRTPYRPVINRFDNYNQWLYDLIVEWLLP
jgi:hypothetical protein